LGGLFGRQAPLHVELGTGKGDFISQLAERYPNINFIGIEAQQDVLYSAAQKIAEKGLTNVRLLVFDINNIENIFDEGEVDRFYINFCDPWPKKASCEASSDACRFFGEISEVPEETGRAALQDG
jgi:tRNA (guanine-N7-)-methyltransferase